MKRCNWSQLNLSDCDFLENFVFYSKSSKSSSVKKLENRISTIRKCDKVYVIDKNVISEAGTHDELLSKNGVYRRIWDNQIGKNVKKKVVVYKNLKKSPVAKAEMK